MFGHLRLAEMQMMDQVANGAWTSEQEFDDLKAAGLGEGSEGFQHGKCEYAPRHIFVSRHILVWEYKKGFHSLGGSSAQGKDLRQLGGKVRHHQKRGIDLLDEFPIGFGLVADALPFGIVAKGLPVGGSGFATGMRQDVNEGLALKRFVGGRPVRHVLDSMLLEKLYSVFAKAAKQVVKLAFESVVDTEFVDRRGGRLFLSRGKPVRRWEKRCYR